VAPDPSAPTTAPSPAVSRRPGCLAATLAHRSCLRRPSAPAGLRLRPPPEGDQRPGVTRRPLRLPVTVADSSLHPIARRRSSARSEMAGEHCPCSDSAVPRERRGVGRSPVLTAPVGVRSPERGSVKTPQNPWSTPLSKNTGLSTELLRYPQEIVHRPPVAHGSCTAMCTASDPAVTISAAPMSSRVLISDRCSGFNGGR